MRRGNEGGVCSRRAARELCSGAAAVTGLVAGLLLVFVGLSSLPAGADAPPSNRGSMVDRLGDVIDLQAVPVTVPRADITGAAVEYGPGWIRLEVSVFNATDPAKDPNWQSDDTYAVWSLDTNADGKADYLVEYGITSDGQLYGDVFRPDSGKDDPTLCEATSVSHSGTAAGGVYTMVIDPACIGRPNAIAYTAGLSYDTGGGHGAGPVGTDIVPDTGFAAAVAAPGVTALGAAPPVGQAPPVIAAPAVTAPAAGPTTTERQAPTPTPAASAAVTPSATEPPRPVGGGSAPAPKSATAPRGPGATATTSGGELARTGSTRLRPMAALGLGLFLMGAGLRLMLRPSISPA